MMKYIMITIFSCIFMPYVSMSQKYGVELSFIIEAVNGSIDSIRVTQENLTPNILRNSKDSNGVIPFKKEKEF
jgi:hypothetical protein